MATKPCKCQNCGKRYDRSGVPADGRCTNCGRKQIVCTPALIAAAVGRTLKPTPRGAKPKPKPATKPKNKPK